MLLKVLFDLNELDISDLEALCESTKLQQIGDFLIVEKQWFVLIK